MSEWLLYRHANFDPSELIPNTGLSRAFAQIEPDEIASILFDTHGWFRKRNRIVEVLEGLRDAHMRKPDPDFICADLKDELTIYLKSERNPAEVLYSDFIYSYELNDENQPMIKLGYRPQSPGGCLGIKLFKVLHSWKPEDEIADE